MILLLHFTIEQAVVFYQQDSMCHVSLTNAGQAAIQITEPKTDETLPIVYVLDIHTGVEEVYRGNQSPHVSPEPLSLLPGQKKECSFSLLSDIPNLPPGEYDISVGWEYNEGQETARSNTVRVKVVQSTPTSLSLANTVGGRSGHKHGTWVDVANDPPCVMYGGFDLNLGGGMKNVTKIAPLKELVHPVISSPVNRTPLRSHWLAWLDKKGVNYTHIDKKSGILKPQCLKFKGIEAEIITPFYGAKTKDPQVRPEGLVLVCSKTPTATQFLGQTIRLSTKKAEVIGQAEFHGPKPLWIANHARSEQQLLMTYLQTDGNTLTLNSAPWPGITSEFSRPTRLAALKGQFLAADAVLVNDGVIRGGILMWKHLEGTPNRLVVVTWTLDENNKFELQPEHAIDWEPADLIQTAIMRVSDGGRPVALFTDVEETWHIYDGKGKVLPMPAPYQKTKQLIEIGFINGISDPLLICGTVQNGFKIIQLDGSPIPPRMTK